MEKFQLTLLFKIIGIGSASGLVYHDEKLYLISDNSTFLYEYSIPTEKLNKIALVENAQDNIAKKDKPDFEAIANNGKKLVIIGSGSTKNRTMDYKYELETGKITQNDLAYFYSEIRNSLEIGEEELNIEGLIINGNFTYLFQRGNGALGKNSIVCVENGDNFMNIVSFPYELPKIKNVPTTFTDAVLVNDTIYFLASAEDTTSTYLDGEVLGSIIGTIDIKTMTLTGSVQISATNKFEGLTLYKQSENKIEFLLCEDTDSDVLESKIYTLTLKR